MWLPYVASDTDSVASNKLMNPKFTDRLSGVDCGRTASLVTFMFRASQSSELPLRLATPHLIMSQYVHTSVNIGHQQVTVDILTPAIPTFRHGFAQPVFKMNLRCKKTTLVNKTTKTN